MSSFTPHSIFGHWHLQICRNIRDKLLNWIDWCPWLRNVFLLQQHAQILLPHRVYSLCFLVKAIQFVKCIAVKWFGHSWSLRCAKEFLLWLHQEHFDCPHQYHRFHRSVLMVFKFLAHGCYCPVDTELIDVKNNAINCINFMLISSEVCGQFSMSFALENTPEQWSRCTE